MLTSLWQIPRRCAPAVDSSYAAKVFSNDSRRRQLLGMKERSNGVSTRHSPSSDRWLTRQKKDKYVKAAQKEGLPSRAFFKLEHIDRKIASLAQSSSQKKKKKQRQSGVTKRLFDPRKQQTVIDLGAAPGGWSAYASKQVGAKGTIIAIDLLELDSTVRSNLSSAYPADFFFLQGDFREPITKEWILETLNSSHIQDADTPLNENNDTMCSSSSNVGTSVHESNNGSMADIIISDMAANFTGDQLTDALRTLSLCEDALMFAIGSYCFDENSSTPASTNTDSRMESLSSVAATGVPCLDHGVLKEGGTFLCKYFKCGQALEKNLMEAVRRNFTQVDLVKPPSSRRESSEQYLLARNFKRRQ